MLLRANAVGYTNYPNNLIREFIRESAASGIDVFRIFDSLNWEKVWVAIDEARNTGKIAEQPFVVGDLLDESRAKISVQYFIKDGERLSNWCIF